MFIPEEEILHKKGPNWHGTSIAWNLDIAKFIRRLPVTSDRFCGLLYSSEECTFLAYSLYLPTSGQDEAFNEVLAALSADIVRYMTEDMGLIIGADTNQSVKSSQRRQMSMNEFKESFNLNSILFTDTPTFHHNNQTSSSQIDDILVKKMDESIIDITLHELLCKLEYPMNLSSHDVVVASLTLPEKENDSIKSDYTNTYKQFVVNKPKWLPTDIELYQQTVNKALLDIFERFEKPEFVPALTEMCSNALVISAELTLDTKKPNYEQTKRLPKFSSTVSLA